MEPPQRTPAGVFGGDLAARLERWAAEARVDEAARRRSRERWLRRQAEEDATVAGVLADLLEAGRPVTVCSRTGRRHTGLAARLPRQVHVLDGRITFDNDPMAAGDETYSGNDRTSGRRP